MERLSPSFRSDSMISIPFPRPTPHKNRCTCPACFLTSAPVSRTDTSPLLPKHEDGVRIVPFQKLPDILPVMVAVFVAAMDTTVGLTVYESMASDYQQLFNANWIPILYFLTSFACFPLHYELLRRYDWKTSLLFALIVFTFGAIYTVLPCTTSDFAHLLISRAIMGAGAGFMLSMGPILLFSGTIDPRSLPVYKLCFSVALSLGCAVGSPLGGYFAVFWTWRHAFWLELLLALCVMSTTIPIRVQQTTSRGDKGSSIMRGVLQMTMLSTVLLLFAYLIDKPSATPHDFILALVAVFCTFLSLRPLISTATFFVFICSIITTAGAYHISLFQQTVFLKPAHIAGAWLTPAVIGAFFGGLLGGSVPILSGLLQIAGTVIALMHVGVVHKQLEGLVSGWVLTNIGNAAILSNISVPPSSCEDKQSFAVSLAGARSLGSLFGVALGFTMSKRTTLEYIPLEKIPASLPIIRLPDQIDAVNAYEMGVRGTMSCVIVLACFVAVCLVFIKVKRTLGER